MCCCALVEPQGAKVGPNILADWSNTKAATEHSLKLLQTYKEIGETEKEVISQSCLSICTLNTQQLGFGCPANTSFDIPTSSNKHLHLAYTAMHSELIYTRLLPALCAQWLCVCCLQPYLQHHNPRTFEDLTKPVPNFKKFNLKPGQVPKFFDGVLQKRVGDALAVKGDWWESRKKAAEAAAADKSLKVSCRYLCTAGVRIDQRQ